MMRITTVAVSSMTISASNGGIIGTPIRCLAVEGG